MGQNHGWLLVLIDCLPSPSSSIIPAGGTICSHSNSPCGFSQTNHSRLNVLRDEFNNCPEEQIFGLWVLPAGDVTFRHIRLKVLLGSSRKNWSLSAEWVKRPGKVHKVSMLRRPASMVTILVTISFPSKVNFKDGQLLKGYSAPDLIGSM